MPGGGIIEADNRVSPAYADFDSRIMTIIKNRNDSRHAGSAAAGRNQHPASASCSGVLHRHLVLTPCFGNTYRHPAKGGFRATSVRGEITGILRPP